MLPLDHPDRIQTSFDDHRLVANPESTEGMRWSRSDEA